MVKRWSVHQREHVEAPEIDAFLAEVRSVCERHRLWISHEDIGGGFIVTDDPAQTWLDEASDGREPKDT